MARPGGTSKGDSVLTQPIIILINQTTSTFISLYYIFKLFKFDIFVFKCILINELLTC